MPKKIKRCEKCCRPFPKLEVVIVGNESMTVEEPVAQEIWRLRRRLLLIRLQIDEETSLTDLLKK